MPSEEHKKLIYQYRDLWLADRNDLGEEDCPVIMTPTELEQFEADIESMDAEAAYYLSNHFGGSMEGTLRHQITEACWAPLLHHIVDTWMNAVVSGEPSPYCRD